jgi:hypothetical protein
VREPSRGVEENATRTKPIHRFGQVSLDGRCGVARLLRLNDFAGARETARASIALDAEHTKKLLQNAQEGPHKFPTLEGSNIVSPRSDRCLDLETAVPEPR